MIGTIGILFLMNVYLGILIAVLLIAKTLHTVYVNKKMKAAFRENRVKSGEITARAEESLGGIRLVKAFAQEEYELARLWKKVWIFWKQDEDLIKFCLFFWQRKFFYKYYQLTYFGLWRVVNSQG